LFICRGIVEQHGGAIWASSGGLGKGSTFHIVLPIDAAAGALSQSPQRTLEGTMEIRAFAVEHVS
ncbi:MAG: hypothetical protein ACRDG4_18215, partial [Chloroflexota bacterium]